MKKNILKNNNIFNFYSKVITVTFLVFVLGLFFSLNIVLADTSCANGSVLSLSETINAEQTGKIDVVFTKVSSSQARTFITNNTGCSLPVSVKSYKVYDNVSFNTQTLFNNSGVVMVPAHSSHTINSNIPSCMAQVDTYYEYQGVSKDFYGIGFGPDGSVFHSIASFRGQFCSNTVVLGGSCSVNPTSINTGASLNWSATATGGNGVYTYSWSGTDGLYGNSSYISKSYFNAGTKDATVTISSNGSSIVRSCSAVVNPPVVNNLSGSCSVNPSNIEVGEYLNWSATATGGNGVYTYSWSGTDGLYGNSSYISKSYFNTGTKDATVTISSNGQSTVATCHGSVSSNHYFNNLSVSCYANPSNSQVGTRVNWYSNVSGGDGDYNYRWRGTDSLNSSNRAPYITYYNPGNKSASVTVTDGNGDTATAYCNVNVTQNSVLAFSQYNPLPLEGAVYLNQIPYTGLADNYKLAIFISILALISAWVAYVITSYQKNNNETK